MISAFIKQQLLEVAESIIVSDTFNYLKAQFIFISSDWNGLEKTAYFKQDDKEYAIRLDENNIAYPIHLTEGEWKISVVGKALEYGELVKRITTDSATIEVKAFEGGGENPLPEIEPTEADRLDAKIGNLLDLLTGNKTDIVNAINEIYRRGGGGGGGGDGFSPTIEVTKITGGHRVTIVDINGKKTFDILDAPSDHSKLTNRNTENQHPISAITGLQSKLDNLQNAKNIIFTNNDPEFWDNENDINVQTAIEWLKFRQLYILNRAESIIYKPADPDFELGDASNIQTAIDMIFGTIKEIALAEYITAEDMPEIVKSVIDNLPKYNGEVAEV